MIQVLGEMSNRGGPSQKFVQTFFLAEQPRGYYVLNDIFRYLKEDAELEVEAGVEAVEEEPLPEYKIEAETDAAAAVTDAAPEAAAVVIEEAASVVAVTVEVFTPEAVEPVSEQKIEVVEEKKAAPASEEKKPAEKKAEHKKHDRKAEKKDSHKKEAKKETEASEKPKTPEPSKKQPNGAAASAPAPEVIETPAPAPVVAPAPVPAEPPKPKTWANLAANNSNQWGSHASAAKGSSVNVTPVATPKSQTPVPAQQQNNKPLDRKPNTINNNAREEMLFIYVKNITEKMSLDQLREAFAKFGSVKNIELTHKKNCAYIEFATVEAVQAALKQNRVSVGSETVLAEERRPRNTTGFQNGGRPFYANGGPNGHHQGFQGAHRGARGAARGGFQDRKPIQRPEKAAPTVAVN
ncbi:unnamed protein product [Mortierella alpina]